MKRRKIAINGGNYEVWGDKPWIVFALPNGRIIIDEAVLEHVQDFTKNPQKYNALRRIGTSGVTLPVLFTGDSGRAMAEEIAFILNQKL